MLDPIYSGQRLIKIIKDTHRNKPQISALISDYCILLWFEYSPGSKHCSFLCNSSCSNASLALTLEIRDKRLVGLENIICIKMIIIEMV